MFLSRLILNPRSKAVRRDLADCQALHRTLMTAFPNVQGVQAPRESVGLLHRLETHPRTGLPILLVQSRMAADWNHLPGDYLEHGQAEQNPSCKPIAESLGAIQDGQRLQFRLRGNPTRKIDTRSGPDGQRRNGRRVDLRDDADRLAWLQRKAREGGFEVLAVSASADVPDVRTAREPVQVGYRPDPRDGKHRKLTFGGVLFDGHLRVTDPEVFRRTLETGIGSAKAYGYGLLSVAPGG